MIADYLIAKSGGTLDPVHLLELVYISHGYTLAIKQRPLVYDIVRARTEAPTIESLYYQLRRYGSSPITRFLYNNKDVTTGSDISEQTNFLDRELADHRDVLDRVYEQFGSLSCRDLLTITHKTGSPWDQCYVHKTPFNNIPDCITKEYYEKILECHVAQ